jgi:hypothetical protein
MLPELPYEQIGQATVGILIGVFSLLLLGVIVVVSYMVWYRGLTYISNSIWSEYDYSEGESPPTHWHVVSVVAINLRNFETEPEKWKESIELAREN